MHIALMLAALAPTALAGDFIVATGPEVELQNSGTWARVIATADGWKLAHASNGDFYVADLSKTGDALGDWEMDRDSRVQLTQHGELKDHAIKRCPDGTYLHVASANVEQNNDSAYGWRYSADWEVIAQAPIEEREPARAHNDMGLYCSALGAGVAFGGDGGPPAILSIDADLDATVAKELDFSVRATGAGMWVDPEAEIISMFYTDFAGNLYRLDMDPQLNQLSSVNRPITEPDLRAYWPQGVLRVGDYWLVAHMVRPQQTSTGGDDGNVRLLVVDDELQIQDEATLTDNAIEDAGMRPWIARKGDQVVMSYDRQRQHTVMEIRLDLDAFNVDPDADTGWDGSDGWGGEGGGSGSDGGAGDDTAGDDDDADKDGCGGCAAPGGAPLGVAAAAGLVALARRRRRV
jgi:hypothetical protein